MRLALTVGRICGALLLTAVGAAGCTPTEPGDTATFEGSWAGRPWRGDAHVSFYPAPDSMWIVGSGTVEVGTGAERQRIPAGVRISTAYRGPGTYELKPGDAEVSYLIGGDVRTAAYGIAGAQRGTLVIEERTASRLRGQVSFDATSLMENSPVGATARFEGRFDARIITIRP
jgi:hypothetical protein